MEYLDFSWCDTLWYYDEDANFPQEHRKLGSGWVWHIELDVGEALSFYILNEHAKVIVCSTIQPITREEFETTVVKDQIKNLDILIQECIGKANLANMPIELQDEYEILEP